MGVILDSYDYPAYLTRIWALYELYWCSHLVAKESLAWPDVDVLLPPKSNDELGRILEKGNDGIKECESVLCVVDSKRAEATDANAKANIKEHMLDRVIKTRGQSEVGFARVDSQVNGLLRRWLLRQATN